jgi:hypothetical protein
MNIVQPLHEKKGRGRPRNADVLENARLFFPEANSRRSKWNVHYMVLAMGNMMRAGLVDQAAIRDGSSEPLPPTVMHALGVIPEGALFTKLATKCIAQRAAGARARDLVESVRAAHLRAAMEVAVSLAKKKPKKKRQK